MKQMGSPQTEKAKKYRKTHPWRRLSERELAVLEKCVCSECGSADVDDLRWHKTFRRVYCLGHIRQVSDLSETPHVGRPRDPNAKTRDWNAYCRDYYAAHRTHILTKAKERRQSDAGIRTARNPTSDTLCQCCQSPQPSKDDLRLANFRVKTKTKHGTTTTPCTRWKLVCLTCLKKAYGTDKLV